MYTVGLGSQITITENCSNRRKINATFDQYRSQRTCNPIYQKSRAPQQTGEKCITQTQKEIPIRISDRHTKVVGLGEQMIRKMKKIALEKGITYSDVILK